MKEQSNFKREISKVIGLDMDEGINERLLSMEINIKTKNTNTLTIKADNNNTTSTYISKSYCHCNSFSIPDKLRMKYGINSEHIKASEPMRKCEICNEYLFIFTNKETEDKWGFYAAEAKKLVMVFKVIENERNEPKRSNIKFSISFGK